VILRLLPKLIMSIKPLDFSPSKGYDRRLPFFESGMKSLQTSHLGLIRDL